MSNKNLSRDIFFVLNAAMNTPGKEALVSGIMVSQDEVYSELVPTLMQYVETLKLTGFTLREVGYGFFVITYTDGSKHNYWNVEWE